MSFKKIFSSSLLFAALAAGLLASNVGFAQTATRVFELRTYTTNDGKLTTCSTAFAITPCACSQSTTWSASATGYRKTNPTH